LQETRTADIAAYNYHNLCFTLSHFFGHPGRTLLEKSMKEKGLDQALQDYGKAGTMTRDLLHSTDMYDYLAGMSTLGCLLADGEHTLLDVSEYSPLEGNPAFKDKYEAIRKAKMDEFMGYCPEYFPIAKLLADRKALRDQLRVKRKAAIGEGVNYKKVGNTAYCLFDSFLCDESGWRKYYKGEGPRPTIEEYPNDWLVILLDAIERAEADPEVKNFIIDISTNDGGSSDVVLFILSLFCNKSSLYYENTLIGQKTVATYDVDRNLDGKFDEKDAEVKYHLNVALLTSCFSFSCANLLPSMMKDNGVPIIGQRSGGGSCCVQFSNTAEGLAYSYSSHRSRLHSVKGENIDVGVEPDYVIEQTDNYFDIPQLGKYIEDYYKNSSMK
jgi:hypothetical protein